MNLGVRDFFFFLNEKKGLIRCFFGWGVCFLLLLLLFFIKNIVKGGKSEEGKEKGKRWREKGERRREKAGKLKRKGEGY